MFGRNEHGSTLLEALVALVIVGLTVAGALGIAGADARASRTAASTLEATVLAEQLLQRSALALQDGALTAGLSDEGEFAPPMHRFRWTRVSRHVPGESELIEVEVAVHSADISVRMATRSAAPLAPPASP